VIDRLRRWTGRRSAGWSDLAPFFRRAELHPDAIAVDLVPPAHENWIADESEHSITCEDGILRITSPVKVQTRGGRTSRIDGSARPARSRPDKALIAGLRRAHAELKSRGLDMLDPRSSLDDARGLGDPYLRKLGSLAFLAPDIQRAILEGRQPPGLKLADLLRLELPLGWNEQRHLLGFA
jgi:hypothetical protein